MAHLATLLYHLQYVLFAGMMMAKAATQSVVSVASLMLVDAVKRDHRQLLI